MYIYSKITAENICIYVKIYIYLIKLIFLTWILTLKIEMLDEILTKSQKKIREKRWVDLG